MPKVPILMPQLGESIAEATVLRMLVAPGDEVMADQEVFEVETNKATMGVTTICGGVVTEILIQEGESIVVGARMGTIEATEEEIERCGATAMGDNDVAPTLPTSPESVPISASSLANNSDGAHFQVTGEFQEQPSLVVQPSVRGLPVPVGIKGAHYLSPRMKARMDELGMRSSDIASITGSGSGGRVTIDDLEHFLDYVGEWPKRRASSMRLAVADSMRRSWTRPLASAGRPVYMDPILKHRKNHPLRPGVTLYFVRAFALAIAEAPECAGYLVGGNILMPKAIDIGIAAQVADGVMVPVLRRVNERTLDELLEDYNKLIAQARSRRLSPEDQRGGIATVTNFGGFGLTFASPMPMPSESLILGVGAVTKAPVWSDEVEAFIPISKANIVGTFDHRVIDGGDAGRLLKRVAELLQRPEYL
ncbi:MAG: dihydrolipoamide acetyltransferase family protein [Akkermansia sp.]